MYNNCQVCGNPIFSATDYGTDADGRLNTDFCSNCYKGGNFYSRDDGGGLDDRISYAPLLAGRSGLGMTNGFGNGGMGVL